MLTATPVAGPDPTDGAIIVETAMPALFEQAGLPVSAAALAGAAVSESFASGSQKQGSNSYEQAIGTTVAVDAIGLESTRHAAAALETIELRGGSVPQEPQPLGFQSTQAQTPPFQSVFRAADSAGDPLAADSYGRGFLRFRGRRRSPRIVVPSGPNANLPDVPGTPVHMRNTPKNGASLRQAVDRGGPLL